MDKRFSQDSYLHAGWIPMSPLRQTIRLGDLCQIQSGRLLPLLNVHDIGLNTPLQSSAAIPLSSSDWNHQYACVQEQNSIQVIEEGEQQQTFREQSYRFDAAGSYLFWGVRPHAHLLMNWHQVAQELIVKMTQSLYRFNELIAITGVAEFPHWGLAIAGQEGAQLQLVGDMTASDCLFASAECQTADSRLLKILDYSKEQPLYFFKAKKLTLSSKLKDRYLQRLLSAGQTYSERNIQNWLQSDLLNLARSEELTINSSAEFFEWQDVCLDEVERLSHD